MDIKEFLFTVLAVAVAIIVAKVVSSKLPASLGGGGSWEESYEEANV